MPFIIALILVVISGLVAAAGDFMGQRAARRKVRIGNLRPRHTSRLIAVISGVLISLATYGAMFLLYTDFRRAVTEYDATVARYHKAVADRDAADKQVQQSQQALQQAQTSLTDVSSRLSSADAEVKKLQQSKIDLVREADANRKEAAKWAGQVQVAQNDLKRTNTQLASAHRELDKSLAQVSEQRGTIVRSQINLGKLRTGDIILPKGAEITRVEIPAADVPQLSAKLHAALDSAKHRLADELNLVVKTGADDALDAYVARYPFADPATDAVVAISSANNVVAGDTVEVRFSATPVKPLLGPGELLLTIRIADTGARITARGQPAHEVPFPDGLTTKALEDTIVEAGSDFVDAMLDLGFIPPASGQDTELAAPVAQIADQGGVLLSHERPYVIQLATKSSLTSSQWPSSVTINIFKEPGS